MANSGGRQVAKPLQDVAWALLRGSSQLISKWLISMVDLVLNGL